MALSLSDATTGWSFTCLTDAAGTRPPPGGIVLQDIQHDQHNFAQDLRLIGIRLKLQEVTRTGAVARTFWHFLSLSEPPFSVSTIRVLGPAPVTMTVAGMTGTFRYLREADDALWFRTYFRSGVNYVAFGVRADYKLPASYFAAHWPNCEANGLEVSQRFLFSAYGHSPPHEPGGVLDAARCHPLTRYSLSQTPAASVDISRNRIRVASVRFDYRIHLTIDPLTTPTPAGQPWALPNNAGLFKGRRERGHSQRHRRAPHRRGHVAGRVRGR